MSMDEKKTRAAEIERTTTATGYLAEMFCSIQGEGLYVGEPQLFFRTAGCHLTCYWCDTVSSKKERPICLVHADRKRSFPNPIGADRAVGEALELLREANAGRPREDAAEESVRGARIPRGGIRTVSITGGEPLEQPDFVLEAAARFKAEGLRIYLDTSGVEVKAIWKVGPVCNVVAMDVKLPYATGREHWSAHRDFLGFLVDTRVEVFVKVVVDHVTPLSEIEQAIRLVSSVDRSVPVVLQPESRTYLKGANGPEARKTLENLLQEGRRAGMARLRDVRVIPQVHKIMKVR